MRCLRGRARRRAPATQRSIRGLSDAPDAPLAESLFSIQFVPAYALALIARALSLSVPTLFIALVPFVAFTASLALFWLLSLLTRDEQLAAAGVVIILGLGVLASGQGTLWSLTGRRTFPIFMPFVRRHLPGLPFPLLFLFFACVWRALVGGDERARRGWVLAAGVIFALLVFSYFYLWTTAAGWLACLALLWLITRRSSDDRKEALKVFFTLGAIALAALAPYAVLLSRRAANMDAVQAYELTRAPDVWRMPVLISLIALSALAFGVWRKLLDARDKLVLLTVSLALTPLVVFNQQLLTGRSLQPIHYKFFTANYIALLALLLAVWLLWRKISAGDSARRYARLAVVCVTALAYAICALDAVKITWMFKPTNVLRDRQLEVAWRMAEIGRESDTHASPRPVAFVTSPTLADNLPIVAPQAVLWAPHMLVFSGLDASQHKERMYEFFYYTGVAPDGFPEYLAANRNLIYMLFGPARALPYLSTRYAPVTDAEIAAEQQTYANYVATFNRERARQPLLSYVVASPQHKFDLSNLDRWYERDAGERVGDHMIYRVKLRP